MQEERPLLSVQGEDYLHMSGAWTLAQYDALTQLLDNMKLASGSAFLSIDASGLQRLDTVGMVMLKRWLASQGVGAGQANWLNVPEHNKAFIEQVMHYETGDIPSSLPALAPVAASIAAIGKWTSLTYKEMHGILGFAGQIFVALAGLIKCPKGLRVNAWVRHMDESGVRAIPIVGLLAFLISIVLAYQGATQLKMFGADIFTVDLTVISILREMGVLLTAIMVAGRSGSAFAAEIGVMKLNEEVDALRTIHLDPFLVLVVPRVLALIVVMPVLTFLADLCGIAGTYLMGYTLLDISLDQFLERCEMVIKLNTFMVGIIKAPVFGFLIALVGTYQGMQVDGSAESVGRLTTASVVQSIFLVILADALFSILFSEFGI